MEIKYLEERVEKAEEKVEKCKSTINKHEKLLIKKIANGDTYEIKWKQDDIKGATKKLEEAEAILNNWKSKLNIEVEKERFIEGNAPQVIKDFLEQWKTMAYDWHVQRYDKYQEYKKDLAEQESEARVYCVKTMIEYAEYLDENGEIKDYWKNNLINAYPKKPMESYLKEKELDYKTIKAKERDFAGYMVIKMCDFRDKEERLAWLEKQMEAEKKAKMIDLILRVNKVVGVITDAGGLMINNKGNLDGIIVGEEGTAKIETISAGGYNIQCFHFRTLVHELV